MAVWLLTNTVGAVATALNNPLSLALDSGYDRMNVISGPRSQMVRYLASSSYSVTYSCPSTQITHCVVSRMDLFKNTLDAQDVKLQYNGPSYATDSTTLAGDLDLVGPTGQDWVQSFAQTSTQFRVLFSSSASNRELMVGKVYLSNGFKFNDEGPALGPTLGRRPGERPDYVQPIYGYEPYAVENDFSLSWQGVTRAKVEAFQALPLNWPFWIYDDAGDIFEHKAEHVVLADPFEYQRVGSDYFNITLRFRRLAHYD